MAETDPNSGMHPYGYILENIDSVPHLEALMLLWNSRPAEWAEEDLAARLYIPVDRVQGLLRDLMRLHLIREAQTKPATYSYLSRSVEQDEMMSRVDAAYRQDLVRISTMIHSRSSSVREFARAFRFKKGRD
jgi:hypothetical protein